MSSTKSKCNVDTALVANGCSGRWDVAIDRTISEPERWFLQIESPSVYLYFEIDSPKAIEEALRFAKTRFRSNNEAADEGVSLGSFARQPVSLSWDDEFSDRCFFLIGDSAESHFRLSVVGDELAQLIAALEQVVADLT